MTSAPLAEDRFYDNVQPSHSKKRTNAMRKAAEAKLDPTVELAATEPRYVVSERLRF